MRRIESVLLHAPGLPYARLEAVLPAALEAVGLSVMRSPADAELVLVDTGEGGAVAYLDNIALARRLALAVATRAGHEVRLFEVVGTGGQRFRFRTEARRALGTGELREGDGVEVDLEDAEKWSGELDEQVGQVLHDFSDVAVRGPRVTMHLRKRPAAKASSPRVATLLQRLKNARSYTAVKQPDGRYELRMELATGGTQTSYCSAAEGEELTRLLER